jgi:hypothetical protein
MHAHSILAHHHCHTPAPSPSQLTAAKVDAILSTYAQGSQASGSGGGSTSTATSLTERRVSLRTTEGEARKEAVSGLKRTFLSDLDSSPKVCLGLPICVTMQLLIQNSVRGRQKVWNRSDKRVRCCEQ